MIVKHIQLFRTVLLLDFQECSTLYCYSAMYGYSEGKSKHLEGTNYQIKYYISRAIKVQTDLSLSYML